jgi:outer membrane protein assembly factor BamB
MPGSAAIGDDGALYIGVHSQRTPTLENVYALDPATGQDLWGFALPAGPLDKWIHPPVIGLDGRVFVVDITSYTLYSLR